MLKHRKKTIEAETHDSHLQSDPGRAIHLRLSAFIRLHLQLKNPYKIELKTTSLAAIQS